jgi:ribonuclease HII
MQVREKQLRRQGARHVAGVDEAGVGPLAGPVVAAAVLFAPRARRLPVDDSKRLTARRREDLCAAIRDTALAVAVGQADVAEIAALNVYHAALLAMRRAVEALSVAPDCLIVDARTIPGLAAAQLAVVHGDASEYSVAAASIVAKVHRDALMADLDATYPLYGFARHKGYATAEHMAAIRRHGACPAHRTSYLALVRLTAPDLFDSAGHGASPDV